MIWRGVASLGLCMGVSGIVDDMVGSGQFGAVYGGKWHFRGVDFE